MADMLLAYYSKEYDGAKIFENLKIANIKDFGDHLNKYNVIYVDMNSVSDDYTAYTEDEDLQVKGVNTIVDYLQYSIIEELKKDQNYAALLSSSNKVGKKNLSTALNVICKHTKEQFIHIMDEWDLIYRDFRNDTQMQISFNNFLRGLLKGKKGQGRFAIAYLTGILPIKKYESESALNSFKEYNRLRPIPYESYFGSTEQEVANIANSPSCHVPQQELREWYEGYRLNGIDIYNPNSVVSAISDSVCLSYWSGTSSNDEVLRLINMDFAGIKNDILNLIEGARIQFDCSSFQNDMVSIEEKGDVFSLLIGLGYLGCSDIPGVQDLMQAYVPNKEIKSALMRIIKKQEWYERMETIKRSESLLKAILELDGKAVAAIIQDVHNSPAVALLDYNDEESLTYCVMTGLLWSTLRKYIAHQEDQAGKGRTDLVYEPAIRGTSPLILIEFK